MNADRMDDLLRELDVASAPDAAFVGSSLTVLSGRARAARRRDATWAGRLARILTPRVPAVPATLAGRPVAAFGLILLLLLALAAGLFLIGSLRHLAPLENGLLIVSVGGQLESVEPSTGVAHPILPAAEGAIGVSRSPDGRRITYWTATTGRTRLFAIGTDGRDRHELAGAVTLDRAGAIDTWSPDSRTLATEVRTNGVARILLVDVATGNARLVTPIDMVAHDPLWSPDGEWIAFRHEMPAGSSVAIIRTDGSGMRDVSGDLRGLSAAGPDTWSPDGWIYFGATDTSGGRDFRASVAGRFSEQLTSAALSAFAIASSPDGTQIAFMVDSPPYGWDVWTAASDGAGPRRVLESAGIASWSTDGQLLLVSWKPSNPNLGGLATVRPDGTDLTVLVPYAPTCRQGWDETCLSGFGWGQPRT